MPMIASSSVLSTMRTLSIQAPSPGRIACQSLPPGRSVPRNRSPSNRPPVMTPTRRSTPGVLPTLIAGCTSRSSVKIGRTFSSVISFGRISDNGRVLATGLPRSLKTSPVPGAWTRNGRQNNLHGCAVQCPLVGAHGRATALTDRDGRDLLEAPLFHSNRVVPRRRAPEGKGDLTSDRVRPKVILTWLVEDKRSV